MIDKPIAIVGRDEEWRALTAFAADDDLGARLGLVYGRRRQGKTFLLEWLSETSRGFMFTAGQQSRAQNLAALGAAYARHTGVPGARFADWPSAIDALLRLGEDRAEPVLVVLDEFPYLLDHSPEVPSLIQTALSPRGRAQQRSRARLILCGSALTAMRRLLIGTAPLRGRASLEMMVHPFSFREAASFWRLESDPELAFRVHALVGGTPAYLGMSGRAPRGRHDFDRWVVDGLLNPRSAMHREGNVLLYEQPEVTDPALYFSVLAAIANGAARRSEVGAVLARPDTSLSHPFAVLEELRLITKTEDALRPRRPVYRINEPVIRLHQLVIGPNEAVLAAIGGDQIWRDAADTVAAKIYGPHLEDLAREWSLVFGGTTSLGGRPNQVQSATIACREHTRGHEIDVVAIEDRPHQPKRIVAIGEVKATTKLMSEAELTRLDHLRQLLPTDLVPTPPRLLLFSRSGFSAELRRRSAARGDVELVDLDRLYHGS